MLLICSTLVIKSSKMCSFCCWGSSNYFINIMMGMGTKRVGMGWRCRCYFIPMSLFSPNPKPDFLNSYWYFCLGALSH